MSKQKTVTLEELVEEFEKIQRSDASLEEKAILANAIRKLDKNHVIVKNYLSKGKLERAFLKAWDHEDIESSYTLMKIYEEVHKTKIAKSWYPLIQLKKSYNRLWEHETIGGGCYPIAKIAVELYPGEEDTKAWLAESAFIIGENILKSEYPNFAVASEYFREVIDQLPSDDEAIMNYLGCKVAEHISSVYIDQDSRLDADEIRSARMLSRLFINQIKDDIPKNAEERKKFLATVIKTVEEKREELLLLFEQNQTFSIRRLIWGDLLTPKVQDTVAQSMNNWKQNAQQLEEARELIKPLEPIALGDYSDYEEEMISDIVSRSSSAMSAQILARQRSGLRVYTRLGGLTSGAYYGSGFGPWGMAVGGIIGTLAAGKAGDAVLDQVAGDRHINIDSTAGSILVTTGQVAEAAIDGALEEAVSVRSLARGTVGYSASRLVGNKAGAAIAIAINIPSIAISAVREVRKDLRETATANSKEEREQIHAVQNFKRKKNISNNLKSFISPFRFLTGFILATIVFAGIIASGGLGAALLPLAQYVVVGAFGVGVLAHTPISKAVGKLFNKAKTYKFKRKVKQSTEPSVIVEDPPVMEQPKKKVKKTTAKPRVKATERLKRKRKKEKKMDDSHTH